MKHASFAITIALLIGMGCSVERRYRVLTFFFDGVPPPPGTTASADSGKAATVEGTTGMPPSEKEGLPPSSQSRVYLHRPYEDGKCDLCHEGMYSNELLKPAEVLCLDCHEKFGRFSGFVHGPVASGQCLACHAAHSAGNSSLLVRTGLELCTSCHVQIDRTEIEEHREMTERTCLDCHGPHFSEYSRYLLRETTQPK